MVATGANVVMIYIFFFCNGEEGLRVSLWSGGFGDGNRGAGRGDVEGRGEGVDGGAGVAPAWRAKGWNRSVSYTPLTPPTNREV